MGEEDFGSPQADWAGRATAVATRTGQPRDGRSAGLDSGTNPAAARFDADGIAIAAARSQGLSVEHWAAVVGIAADGTAAKKKSLHAQEQDTAEAQRKRQAWWEAIRRIDPGQLIFLDESAATTQMTRTYGRARRGERVREGTPGGHWRTVTMLAALTLEGLQAPMTIESATDGDVFLAYLEQVLCPRLGPGRVVIMDNLAAHKVAGVRERIEATGASLVYLPPYSPDFNPIEQAWSKVKQLLRSAKARTLEALEPTLAHALASVTPQNASAWFSHCGYSLR